MTVYKPEELQSGEQLPQAEPGTHQMKIVLEMPKKGDKRLHSFLFQNDTHQAWLSVFKSKLPDFADALGVELLPDGGLDTEKFKGIDVLVTIEKQVSESDGKEYFNVVHVDLANQQQRAANDTSDIPF